MLIKKVCVSTLSCSRWVANKASGRRRPQASREKPKGQGLQVQTHSYRIQNPQTQQILQDCWCSSANLEVRERYRKHHGVVSDTVFVAR